MPFTKYGLGLMIGSWLIFLFFLILSFYVQQTVVIIFAVITGIFSIFNLYFFRDPERTIPADPQAILAPADGKIVQITEVDEHDFFKEKVTRVSIFLSVFNVHVNRNPIGGRVEYFAYNRGRFLAAFNDKASLENEQTAIGIIGEQNRKVMFKQIAGIIARRIVCNLREGYKVKAGERMGMIRYGSRADIFFRTEDVDLRVKLGDKVSGGESIIGVFH
ncbi:MAG: phosphatidylserine decarboxylase family protein [Calditrichia bacterium]